MEKCLFIGGPRDGERLNIDTGQTWIKMPEMERISVFCDHNVTAAADTTMAKNVTYTRELLRAEDSQYYVYVADEIQRRDVIERLIEGYRVHP